MHYVYYFYYITLNKSQKLIYILKEYGKNYYNIIIIIIIIFLKHYRVIRR